MKKILLLAFTLCLLISLCACNFPKQDAELPNNVFYDDSEPKNTPPEDTPDNNTEITIRRRYWFGYGVSSKTITGTAAASIEKQLDNLKKTGEMTNKLADKRIDSFEQLQSSDDYPEVETRGIMWIEAQEKLYRISQDFDQICMVNFPFSSGEILNFPDQLRTEIAEAWHYWPRDSWTGTYQDGMLNIRHRYAANTNITATVKNISVENTDDPNNSITVEFVSRIDQELTVTLDAQYSEDNLCEGDQKTLKLKAGKPQTITLSFGGKKNFYRIGLGLRADNTRIYIEVKP